MASKASIPTLKVYYDLMSQPARTLFMFLRLNAIPFQSCPISIMKGEHLTDDYRRINRFSRIPCIVDDGFALAETPAILLYLAGRYPTVAEHWYPRDAEQKARVDEYISWHHQNTRWHCSAYFWLQWLLPTIKGKRISAVRLSEGRLRMEQTLQDVECLWLGDGRRYIAGGAEMSVADLLAATELEQLSELEDGERGSGGLLLDSRIV